jgi:hypothetical protein
MNTTLDQLAHEAGITVTAESDKFAELIVRECAKVADKGWADPGHQIKQHFGVEE